MSVDASVDFGGPTGVVGKISFYDTREFEFCTTTSGTFRLSFDPCGASRRLSAEVRLVDFSTKLTNVFTFGQTDIPVNAEPTMIEIKSAPQSYLLTVRQLDQIPGTNDFALGLGLKSAQVRFDPRVDLGTVSDRSLYDIGYNYTDGFPYGYLPQANPHEPDACTFLGWAATPHAGTNEIVSVTDTASAATPMLYALWRYSYKVVLHEQEIGGATNVLTLVSDEPSQLPRDVWTRAGYELIWTNGTSVFMNGATVTNLVSKPSDIAHLYASWRDKRSWIAFDANGGAGSMDTIAYSYDAAVTLPANNQSIARIGRSFLGWAKQPDGAVDYADGVSVRNLADAPGGTNVLYAVWGTLDKTIHIEVPSDRTLVTNAAFVSDSKLVMRGTLPASLQQTVEVTNTASQTASLRFSLDPASGARTGLRADVQERRGEAWEPVAGTSDLTNAATSVSFEPGGVYRFKVTGDAAGLTYAVGIGFEGVSVAYDTAGGALTDSAVRHGTNFNFTLSTPYGYFPAVLRSGWHLLGWLYPTTGSRCDSNDVVTTGRTLLQAEWRRDPFDYKVTFSSEGGTGYMEDQTLRYDTSEKLKLNLFTRQGYDFSGWYCSSNGLHYIDGEEVLNLTETPGVSVPLNACWSPIRYYVRYAANGGKGTEVVQTLTYGTEERLAANTYVRLGYDFAGWAETSAGPVKWSDGAVVSNLTWLANETNTLFAVWKRTPGRTVYEDVDGRDFTGVSVATNASVLFAGQATGGQTGSWFTVTFVTNTTCRVSLDPLDAGKRIGTKLEIAERSDKGAWESVCQLTDRDPAETVVTFATNTVYRFSVDASLQSVYRYAVGLGAEGVTVEFDPHRTNAADKKLQLTCNCSVGFAYGWYPELTPDSTNGAFLGWFDTEQADANPLALADTVRADRGRFVARWSQQKWTVAFDWNISGTNLVEKRYYADGVQLGELEQPSAATGTLLSWNTSPYGSGTTYCATNAVVTNLTLYAQWYEGYVMRKTGSRGWIIEKYSGTAASQVEIPSSVDGREIVAIGDEAFADHAELVKVVIPSSVSSVGASAFKDCTGLKEVQFIVETVDEDAETGYLEESVDIGESAFEGCVSLVTCNLPLGVQTLPAGVFRGCTALVKFVMPFTVTAIEEEAFEGCTSLTNAVVPEKVESVGSRAFGGCSRLVATHFLGDAPEAEEDIYADAAARLMSRRFLRTTGWPTDETVWPSGTDSRRLKHLTSNDHPSRKVKFNLNDGSTNAVSTVYYFSGRPFGWLAPEPEGDFQGWWTERLGGRKVGPYEQPSDGQVVYAHWTISSEEGRGSNVSWEDGLTDGNGEGADYRHMDRTFHGIVQDTDGKVRGTITVVCKRPPLSTGYEKTKRMSSVTASVFLLGAKGELQLTGEIDEEGCLAASRGAYRLAAESVAAAGFVGTLTVADGESYGVQCANSNSPAAKENRRLKRSLAAGNWTCLLQTGDVEDLGGGSAAEGCSILSLAVDSDGGVKISGNMADGTSVRQTAEVIYGDGYCCIPIVVPLYTGDLGGFGCALWMTWQEDMSVTTADVSLNGLTEWDASLRKSGAFIAQFDEDASFAVKQGSEPYVGSLSFSIESVPEVEGVTFDELFLPNGTIVQAKRLSWKAPAADRVRFVDGAWCDLSDDQVNPSGLKLTYSSGTGCFTGSFILRGVTDAGSARSYTAKVHGAFFVLQDDDGNTTAMGYGTATANGIDNIPVRLDPIEE